MPQLLLMNQLYNQCLQYYTPVLKRHEQKVAVAFGFAQHPVIFQLPCCCCRLLRAIFLGLKLLKTLKRAESRCRICMLQMLFAFDLAAILDVLYISA